MPRPRKPRHCCRYDADRVYKPQGIPMRDIQTIEISLDQFEALRFCDLDGLDQEEAGREMGVSRGTVQRLLYGARKAVVEAILNNEALLVNLKQGDDCHVGLHTHQHRRGRRRQPV